MLLDTFRGETKLDPGDTRRFPAEALRGEGDENTSSRSIGIVFGLGLFGLSTDRLLAIAANVCPEVLLELLIPSAKNGDLVTKFPLANPFKPILVLGTLDLTSGLSFSLLPDTFLVDPADTFLSPVAVGKATFPRSFETFLVPATAAPLRGLLALIPSPIAALGVAADPVAGGAA